MNINWPVTTLNAARIEYVRIRSTNPPFSRTFSLTNFVNYFRTSEAWLRKFSCKLSSGSVPLGRRVGGIGRLSMLTMPFSMARYGVVRHTSLRESESTAYVATWVTCN